MKPTLVLVALALVAGAAVWYGRSGTLAPTASAAAPATAKDGARLESDGARRKSAGDPAAQPAPGDARGAANALPQPIDPSLVAGGLDGGMPSDASAAGDADPFEAKYAGASKSDLKASYDALKILYDENAEGRAQDKEHQLDPDALAELARELAWLKQKAFGGL